MNVLGLAIGITCCLVLMLWVAQEVSYDKFHENADNLRQIIMHSPSGENSGTPVPLAPVLKEEFPEIVHASRFQELGEVLVGSGEESFYETGIRAVDSDFFEMFSFDLVEGDASKVLDDPNSIVISQEIASKYFGDQNPVGSVLTINTNRDFHVTGVFEKIPFNSTLQFDMVVRFQIVEIMTLEESGREMDWGWWAPQAFIEVRESTIAETFNEKISDTLLRHVAGEDAMVSTMSFTERYPHFWNSMQKVYTFSLVGLLILIIAALNYVNLSTARSTTRAREVGLRKGLGACRSDIRVQLLGESLVMTIAAVLLAVIMTVAVRPALNAVTGLQLSWDSLSWGILLPSLLGATIIIGLAAGAYPAFLVAAFRPVVALRGDFNAGRKARLLRRTLVVIQFAVSALLIVAAGTIHDQINFLQGRDIGYNKDRIVKIALRGDSASMYEAMKNRLRSEGRVTSVSGSAAAFPYWHWSTSEVEWSGKQSDQDMLVHINSVDYDLVETLGIKLVEGRSYSEDQTIDASKSYLINETMAGLLTESSALGHQLTMWETQGEVIGVMKDFHFQSLSAPIGPLVLLLNPEQVRAVAVKIPAENPSSTLAYLEETWSEMAPNFPFEYSFLDQELSAVYQRIEQTGKIARGFSLLAVLVACIGLLGLASFAAQSRSKEIAIRKVMGAAAPRIVTILSRELIGCVLVANLIAWPAAFLIMRVWLQSYAYRAPVSPTGFIFSITLTLVAASAAIGFQTFSAARAKPVDRLRND